MNSYNEHYITLLSTACTIDYPNNTISKFRNKLASPLNLEGEWAVSLLDISLPIRYPNFQGQVIAFVAPVSSKSNTSTIETQENGVDKTMERNINSILNEDDSANETFHSPDSSGEQVFKCKRICRTVWLPSGYYASIGELGAAVVKLYQSTFSDLIERGSIHAELRFTYNEIKNISYFQSKCINVPDDEDDADTITSLEIFMKNQNLLKDHFGLDVLTESISDILDYCYVELSYDRDLHSSSPCNLKKLSKVYVCCDCIDYSSVANNSIKLLTGVPIVNDKKTLMYTSPHTRYHTVQSHNIDSIEIELLSSLVSREMFPIPHNASDSEFVECTLHFKRINDSF